MNRKAELLNKLFENVRIFGGGYGLDTDNSCEITELETITVSSENIVFQAEEKEKTQTIKIEDILEIGIAPGYNQDSVEYLETDGEEGIERTVKAALEYREGFEKELPDDLIDIWVFISLSDGKEIRVLV